MTKNRCGVAAACLALLLCFGCGGGGPSTTLAAQIPNTAAGTWVWTLTSPFGCPTIIEQEFPFLDMDNKMFVVEEDEGDLFSKFTDDAGNLIVMEGTFDSATGLVDVTFCVTEKRPALVLGGGLSICTGKGYVGDPGDSLVDVYNMETGQRIGPVTGGPFMDPRDMGASPDGRYLAVPCVGDSTVKIVDTTTDTVVQTIDANTDTGSKGGDPAINRPTSVVFHPTLNKMYVYNEFVGNTIGDCNYISIFDTTSIPFQFVSNDTIYTGCNPNPATGLCIDPQGNYLVALNGGSSQALHVIDATTDQIVESASALPGNCQCAFTPDGARLIAVGANGTSVYDTANFFSDTESFQSFNIPGWDVAITPDGSRAYITDGDKLDKREVEGVTQVPHIRCFDMINVQEIPPGVSTLRAAWGIDICPGWGFFADSQTASVFDIPNHDVTSLDTQEVSRFVRLVPNADTFVPRIIKVRFTANLTFLNDQRQLDGLSQIVEIRNFQFACQTLSSDNTWVFIQDAVRTSN